MSKVWFVTGASRGLGADIARAAIKNGDRVVATGRDRASVESAIGANDLLYSVELDITDAAQIQRAVDAAVQKFETIDVLVNNAGYGHMGFFEECSSDDIQAQYDTNLFGTFAVTRAVLPVMRKAKRGHVINISSVGGVVAGEMASLYCSSKFAMEGWSESLGFEVKPHGINVTLIEPGPFRTDFLKDESLKHAENRIADYDRQRAIINGMMKERNGRQPGDPAKLAEAIVRFSGEAQPPCRFFAGARATDVAIDKLKKMIEEIEELRDQAIACDGDYEDVWQPPAS